LHVPTAQVWVVRDSQKIIIVMDVGVDLVRDKQENITRQAALKLVHYVIDANRILSEVTEYKIEIQKIRPSETNREQNVVASM